MRLTQVTYKEFCKFVIKFINTHRFTLNKTKDRGKLSWVNRPHYMGCFAKLKKICKYFISYNVRKDEVTLLIKIKSSDESKLRTVSYRGRRISDN